MSSLYRAGALTLGRGWTWFVVILALSLFCGRCFAGDARVEPTRAASAVVTAFYKWYLHSLKADKEPLQDSRADLARYVSKPLLREIDHRIHSAEGLDADYFIKAQDYLDDWESSIVVTRAELTATGVNVIVELGAGAQAAHCLSVSLVKERRAWKIRQVRAMHSCHGKPAAKLSRSGNPA